jgi:hypothetical protein
VIGQEGVGEEYLAAWIGVFNHGHDARLLPVSRILRMLRYPDQAALIWPEVLCEFPPLPGGALVRLPVIRAAGLTDRAALDWFRDYAASVRHCALEAMGRARTEDERMMIALELAGRRRRRRSVYVLSRQEVDDLATDSRPDIPADREQAQEPADAGGEGRGCLPRGDERRGEPDRPAGKGD